MESKFRIDSRISELAFALIITAHNWGNIDLRNELIESNKSYLNDYHLKFVMELVDFGELQNNQVREQFRNLSI